ncbi:hypothetical protein A2130_02695 [Candidatus Woesebacteria bacterium GWC2_33_12]|uniref:Uncharacterized protein n=1 Tax=Candidatus Woesebacteria bacterium GW2011_GWB1_33_22 TaxID=1618566 RepID=A0A0F9ZJ70_9BACT|nr:MAG: hypothetical protein UR29_C0013G0039 [Candidatus Woesebacteria bacterium GW2011_GWC2_33_12]KKP41725.1 MAG: hypothetical protein UR33_C0011G0040 [Candidatus Woesebacteria bacterium GW2011_GWA2_33_20]KKP44139.1 MAG: hypothetical protein UR35_C0011G0025 [Candidatus Woesebacteria bacterium GW2011_GWB1_33_22]KKP45798.1 MAG: hypothetical protein UR37_C0014G0025 [Microgenomates group bacterium GW2011_GWC1_33_28]KKP50221.1 MAG: hypothetical protein UR41_C0010G0025 [Candidatus Woesebacteria bact
MPNNDDNNQTQKTSNPIIVDEGILPPMPQAGDQSTVISEQLDTTPATVAVNGSAAPSNDIVMPEIVGTTPPKKKFAGGKVIATILGLFFLIGGVGAGVYLTGQDQNVNEKADEIGYRLEQKCTKQGYDPRWCWESSDTICGTDPGHPIECTKVQADWEAEGWECNSVTEPCGGQGGGGGNVNPQCVGPAEAYDTSWNKLSNTQLSQIKVGDKIRFTISDRMGATGSTLTGKAKKARFTINGVLRPEVTTKDPSDNKFYDEYTVTTTDLGLTIFTVKAEVGVLNNWAD